MQTTKKEKKKPFVSYHKKPDELTIDDWQKVLRRQIAAEQPFTITARQGEHPVFTEYTVKNPVSGGVYTIAIRSPERGLNFCTCMDYKTNGLVTPLCFSTIPVTNKNAN